MLTSLVILVACAAPAVADGPKWTSPNEYRVLLTVDPRRKGRSHSPASVDIDLKKALADQKGTGAVDEDSIEVIAYDASGEPWVFDKSRSGNEKYLLPHYVERYFGVPRITLHFVLPDEKSAQYAVYFDSGKSQDGRGASRKPRYPGLVGDGDYFREGFQRREINAAKFDTFCDFDGDGDMDLFKAGVEPFVYCYENVGGNRMVDRGRLTSDRKVLTMPCHQDNGRGWMTIAFCDWDGDGDQDLFPDMGDGPKAGQVLVYENTTAPGGFLTFTERGSLMTRSGKQIGGRFVAVTFADWDADGKTDVIAAGYTNPMFFRNVGTRKDVQHIELDEGKPILEAGKDFAFAPAHLAIADVDGDGDLDLFATQGNGPIYYYANEGTRAKPALSKGVVVAFTDKYLIGDAHTGVAAADFDGDGKVDFVGGRFWERIPVDHPDAPRDFGGLYKNLGAKGSPRFERVDAMHGSPYTERFQMCDPVRQNAVRASDWNNDGKVDLLAGSTDGVIWYFQNQTDNLFPVFAKGELLRLADGKILSRVGKGAHPRHDICDWNNDGKKDLILADGEGFVVLYLNQGTDARPALGPPQDVLSEGKPIDGVGGRSSVLVCDWDNDGKKDLVFADQEYKKSSGYLFFRNIGTDANPEFGAPKPILFNGQPVNYVRPNLGDFVDWDGDGKKDFIACYFEVDVQLHRNIGSGARGEEPVLEGNAANEGVPIVHPFSVQTVSGADAFDFNGDGDLDILTGQGHGGSGLRYFEHDYIDDVVNHTEPIVTVEVTERRP